ncbi:MAG: hypothetical protein AMXMBFR56_63850 [Polyangiaceae bacterium]
MTRDDDKTDETHERRNDRGPALEVVPGGKVAEPTDLIIDKTKKPSVFQLREVTIPPGVAAERAEQIADIAAAAAEPRDTVRDLDRAAQSSPPPPAVLREETDVPAATLAATRGKSRALWSVVAVGLAVVAVTVVVVASGGPTKQTAASDASTTTATAVPPPAVSPSAMPAVTGSAVASGPTQEPAPKPTPSGAIGVKSSPAKPALPPEKVPGPAAPPSAFTTKPPF